MTAIVLQGDARALPLPDASVDLVVTSPPFYALRSYTDNGEHYAEQIGSEPTWQEYIDSLLECTRDWMRVLKPGGSMFIELGDKYSGAQAQNDGRPARGDSASFWRRTDPKRTGIPAKSLMDLPHRYAIRCVDDLGLIKRAEIPWHHVNGLPESVTDRVRRAHSMIFHLVKQPRYYAAVDEIREPQTFTGGEGNQPGRARISGNGVRHRGFASGKDEYNPLGKLPGSVWNIPSQPLTVPAHLGVDHFAAFPMELPRRCVLGWSPPGICVECGEGRRPVVDKRLALDHMQRNIRVGFIDGSEPNGNRRGVNAAIKPTGSTEATITGYACACPTPDAPTRPAVILDPFGGTGTTSLVASMLGRVGVSIDRSADYTRLARWRTHDPGERAKALQVPKPPPVPDGMETLF